MTHSGFKKPYPLVIKHGLLENPPFTSMIFPLTPPFAGDFPTSHV
jgi:hypothetical protein